MASNDTLWQVCVLEEGDVPLEDQAALLLLPSGYVWAKPNEGPEMLAKLMLANVKVRVLPPLKSIYVHIVAKRRVPEDGRLSLCTI